MKLLKVRTYEKILYKSQFVLKEILLNNNILSKKK